MIQAMEKQLQSEGVDVNGVTNVMEEMSRRNRELFKLPPYVLYVSRAFSTLEGIGLSINEDYAILQECYPYLARRLLTDNSPRARAALRAMLYGPGESGGAEPSGTTMTVASGQQIPVLPPKMEQVAGSHNSGGGGFLSPDKLVEMTDGFTSYTAATADADTTKGLQEAGTAFVELLLASAEENRANARPSAAFAESTEVGLDVLATNRNAANNDPYGYGYDETDGSGTSGSSK